MNWLQKALAALASHPMPPDWWFEQQVAKGNYVRVVHQCGWCGKAENHYCQAGAAQLKAIREGR